MPMNSRLSLSVPISSRQSSAASLILEVNSSRFLACVWHPGSSGIEATYIPSVSLSITTLYFRYPTFSSHLIGAGELRVMWIASVSCMTFERFFIYFFISSFFMYSTQHCACAVSSNYMWHLNYINNYIDICFYTYYVEKIYIEIAPSCL